MEIVKRVVLIQRCRGVCTRWSRTSATLAARSASTWECLSCRSSSSSNWRSTSPSTPSSSVDSSASWPPARLPVDRRGARAPVSGCPGSRQRPARAASSRTCSESRHRRTAPPRGCRARFPTTSATSCSTCRLAKRLDGPVGRGAVNDPSR